MSEQIVDIKDATPRPWTRSCFLIQGPNREWITHTGMGNLPPSRSHESEANAELIVRAANSHEALVSALTDLHNMVNYALDSRDALLISKKCPTMEKVRTALGLPVTIWHALGRPCGAPANEAEGITEIAEHVNCPVCLAHLVESEDL